MTCVPFQHTKNLVQWQSSSACSRAVCPVAFARRFQYPIIDADICVPPAAGPTVLLPEVMSGGSLRFSGGGRFDEKSYAAALACRGFGRTVRHSQLGSRFLRCFGRGRSGDLSQRPGRPRGVPIPEIIGGIRERGYELPCLLRVENILDTQISNLHESFRKAIKSLGYKGSVPGAFSP